MIFWNLKPWRYNSWNFQTAIQKMRIPDENGLDKVEAMKNNYRKYKLDCLVVLGGNGTHKTANMLREEGLNVVTLPRQLTMIFGN